MLIMVFKKQELNAERKGLISGFASHLNRSGVTNAAPQRSGQGLEKLSRTCPRAAIPDVCDRCISVVTNHQASADYGESIHSHFLGVGMKAGFAPIASRIGISVASSR